MNPFDERMMKLALRFARQGAAQDEVPIAAIITQGENIVAVAHNQKERLNVATRHAELVAIEKASRALGVWRLTECTMYVTLEPCVMCAGALHQCRMGRVVYGARDPKGGAYGSLYSIHSDERLNHCPREVMPEFMANESSQLLKEFFAAKR